MKITNWKSFQPPFASLESSRPGVRMGIFARTSPNNVPFFS